MKFLLSSAGRVWPQGHDASMLHGRSASEPAVNVMSTRDGRQRAEELFRQHQHEIWVRTDRMFAGLMGLQWLAGIAFAIILSPATWAGAQSQVNPHVWAAVFLGGIIASVPIFLALNRPGSVLTRHAIAVGQMLTSALFIHLLGGRIEGHFHVFGSLAFLACYRDVKVLATATVVTALDHLLRGMFAPETVYGIEVASHWRWLEHAAWVIFEDIFLILSIRESLPEMFANAERQARLELTNADLDQRVTERTRDLEAASQTALRMMEEAVEAREKMEAVEYL